MTNETLLALGTRVTHFDGGASTHGKGTIIAYNGVRPNSYFKEKPAEAIEMAGKAGLLNALVNSSYDGVRCPYVVQFDPASPDTDIGKCYPRGYCDVYEPASVNAVVPEETVFPNETARFLGRRWDNVTNSWGSWMEISGPIYSWFSDDKNYQRIDRI